MGFCSDTGVCVCLDSWGGESCTYEKKSQLTAFLLGFFIGETLVHLFDLYVKKYLKKWC